MSEEATDIGQARGTVPLPDYLTGGLKLVMAIVIFAMMVLFFVDVILRKLFSAPIPGGFEIVQFMLAFSIFCALPLVTWVEGHIVVSIFEGFFTGARKFYQQLFVTLMSVLSLGVLTYLMWLQGLSLHESEQITGFLGVPIFPIAFVMCGLAVVALGIQLLMVWHLVRHRRQGLAANTGA